MDESRQIRFERKIVIGSIIDSEYLKYVYNTLDPNKCASDYSKTLLRWVFDFWKQYQFAPKEKIRDIYERNLDNGRISTGEGEIIEEVLDNLSEEQKKWDSNELEYLISITIEYANSANARHLLENGLDSLDNGDLEGVINDLERFTPVSNNRTSAVIPLATQEQKEAVFGSALEPLFRYPGAVGELLNPHLYAGGFVVYLAQNKGGKSYHLIDAAIRAGEQGKRVLIFQAGDMDQVQAERRMAIYAARKSNLERYCGVLWIPTPDCMENQSGTCEFSHWCNDDQDDFPFDGRTSKFYEEELTAKHMYQAIEDYPNHKTCIECLRECNNTFRNKFRGTVWWRKREKVTPLDLPEYNQLERQGNTRFFTPYKGMQNIRMATYSNESLTASDIKGELKILKEEEDWCPEILVIDYLDLMAADRDTVHLSWRDQENKKWQRIRKLGQGDDKFLVLSASQSDAMGFNKLLLDRSNFSDDRRKLDHVTAMIGINMTNDEKIMGLARLNEIISRETDGTKIVKIAHRLEIGRPILYSFY